MEYKPPAFEVCLDSLSSAKTAVALNASRIELCSALSEGGLTPSLGLIRAIQHHHPNLPIMVMLRPRGGDFCYSETEFETMKFDLLEFKQLFWTAITTTTGEIKKKRSSLKGIVFGILDKDGKVDVERSQELINLATADEQQQVQEKERDEKLVEFTFHRAIDVSRDLEASLDQILDHLPRVNRVLTSGGQSSALKGLDMLKKLTVQAEQHFDRNRNSRNHRKERLIILPGAGIRPDNVRPIIASLQTVGRGGGGTEVHAGASSMKETVMAFRNPNVCMGITEIPNEFLVRVTDERILQDMMSRFK